VRTTCVALKIGQGKIVRVEKLKLADLGTQQTNGGATAARAESKTRNKFLIQKTALYIQINLIWGVAHLSHGDAWHKFKVLIFHVELIAHLEDVVLEHVTAGGLNFVHRRLIQAGTNGVRQRKPNK